MKRKANNGPRATMRRYQISKLQMAMADNYHSYSRYDDPMMAAARYVLGYSPNPPWQVRYKRAYQ